MGKGSRDVGCVSRGYVVDVVAVIGLYVAAWEL